MKRQEKLCHLSQPANKKDSRCSFDCHRLFPRARLAVFLCRVLLYAVKPYSIPNEFVSFLRHISLFRGLEFVFPSPRNRTELAADYINELDRCHCGTAVRIDRKLTNRPLPFPEYRRVIAHATIPPGN